MCIYAECVCVWVQNDGERHGRKERKKEKHEKKTAAIHTGKEKSTKSRGLKIYM